MSAPRPDDFCLRLLISVDLVGSTSLKQRGRTQIHNIVPWVDCFRGFYESFASHLCEQYDEKRAGGIEVPEPWKYNGDEVLLHTTLTNHRQAVTHLQALRSALATYRDKWKVRGEPQEAPFPLDLKATAWVAGFPVRNIVISWDGLHPRDFVGPEVDLGFRLAKEAHRDHIVVDVGLALLLSTALCYHGPKRPLSLLYLGRKELKGILEGQPYPVYAVDCDHPLDHAERRVAGGATPRPACRPHHVVAFADVFFERTLGLTRPFIDGDDAFPLDAKQHHWLIKLRPEIAFEEQRAQGAADAYPAGNREAPDEELNDLSSIALHDPQSGQPSPNPTLP